MKIQVATLLAGALLVSACSTPEVVDTVKVTDGSMTCQDIATEAARVTKVKQEALDSKGVTGTNIAAALLFWPAIIGNNQNANTSIEAANARQVELVKLAKAKNCSIS